MYVEKWITRCDYYLFSYPEPVKGCAVLENKGEGVFKKVAHYGPDFLKNNGLKPLSVKEALAIIERNGGTLKNI